MCLPPKRKLQNTIGKFWSCSAIVTIFILWQVAMSMGIIGGLMLPSSAHVARTFMSELPVLMDNTRVILTEAALGLGFGIAAGFFTAVLMDRLEQAYKAFYLLIVLTQTALTVTMAPLSVLWFRYEMMSKVILIVVTTLFPTTVGLLTGFKSVDPDTVNLLRTMGAGRMQIFHYSKLPGALNQSFSSLRVSASYTVVGAVISEWPGGSGGLGVYMTRVRKAFSFDKIFAVTFLISMIGLLFTRLAKLFQKECMPWEKRQELIGQSSVLSESSRAHSRIQEENMKKKRYAEVLGTAVLVIMPSGCAAPPGQEKASPGWEAASSGQEVASSGQKAVSGKDQAGEETFGQAEGPPKEIIFVLDWMPNTNHTRIYMAEEKGYFKDVGLEVSIVQPPENGAEVLVASGKAQFVVSFQDSLAPAFSGDTRPPVTAVAAVIQHNASDIVSRKGEGMDRPKGLEGMKYATWDLPIEEVTIQDVMEVDGGDFSRVQLISSMVTDEVTAPKTKSVGAIWIFYAWAGVKTEVEGLETDYFAPADLNPVFDFYTSVIIANNDFLGQEPNTVRAFMEAVSRGYQDVVKEPEEAADILCKITPELDSELVKTSQICLADQYQANAERWGYISLNRWNGYYSWLNEKGPVETPIEENTGFSSDYLP